MPRKCTVGSKVLNQLMFIALLPSIIPASILLIFGTPKQTAQSRCLTADDAFRNINLMKEMINLINLHIAHLTLLEEISRLSSTGSTEKDGPLFHEIYAKKILTSAQKIAARICCIHEGHKLKRTVDIKPHPDMDPDIPAMTLGEEKASQDCNTPKVDGHAADSMHGNYSDTNAVSEAMLADTKPRIPKYMQESEKECEFKQHAFKSMQKTDQELQAPEIRILLEKSVTRTLAVDWQALLGPLISNNILNTKTHQQLNDLLHAKKNNEQNSLQDIERLQTALEQSLTIEQFEHSQASLDERTPITESIGHIRSILETQNIRFLERGIKVFYRHAYQIHLGPKTLKVAVLSNVILMNAASFCVIYFVIHSPAIDGIFSEKASLLLSIGPIIPFLVMPAILIILCLHNSLCGHATKFTFAQIDNELNDTDLEIQPKMLTATKWVLSSSIVLASPLSMLITLVCAPIIGIAELISHAVTKNKGESNKTTPQTGAPFYDLSGTSLSAQVVIINSNTTTAQNMNNI